MKKLVIIGAGELGREMFYSARMSEGYMTYFELKGYIDDVMYANPDAPKYAHVPLPLLNSIDNYQPEPDDTFICAVGNPQGRSIVVSKITSRVGGVEWLTLKHKTSIVVDTAKIGKGVFLGPYTCIGPETSIADHVMINTHSAVGHDAVLGKYSCLMSYVDITGHTTLGEGVFMGSGSRTVPGAKIGSWAYVGLGSVVLRKVRENTKVFGNPAVPIEV